MATTKTPLAANAWTNLGTTPCFLQVVNGPVLFVLDTATPGTLGAAAHTLGADRDKFLDIGISGMNVYARSVDASSSVVVSR